MNASIRAIAAPLLLASVLVAAGQASAIYVITPLQLTVSASEAQVGDALTLDLSPGPDYEGPSHAGATVTVQYGYDPHEGEQAASGSPDEPVSDETPAEDGETPYVHREVAPVTLDDASRASLSWTVPEEVDDRNVFLTVLSEKGETLASAHVRVGDAAPIMVALRSGAAEGEPVPEPAVDEAAGGGDADAGAQPQGEAGSGSGRAVPTAGLILTAAVVGALAVALRRR